MARFISTGDMCIVSDYNNSDITILGARYKSNRHFSISIFASHFLRPAWLGLAWPVEFVWNRNPCFWTHLHWIRLDFRITKPFRCKQVHLVENKMPKNEDKQNHWTWNLSLSLSSPFLCLFLSCSFVYCMVDPMTIYWLNWKECQWVCSCIQYCRTSSANRLL